jgi:hypothetical protein
LKERGDYVVTSNTRLNIAIGLLLTLVCGVAKLFFDLGDANRDWTSWRHSQDERMTSAEARLQALDGKQFIPVSPPRVQK